MSTPVHAMLTGTFTSDGLARQLSLPSGYDSFELINISDIGDAGATTQVMRAKGYSSLPAGSAYLNLKTNGAATLAIESMITTAGFTFLSDSGIQTPGAAVAVTAITNANPAVVSSASAAVVGDIVRVYGTTGMLQVAGWDFTVTAVNPGVTQSLGYLNAAGFLAPATAGFIRVIPFNPRYYPRSRQITAITQAASAVITLSVTHGYTVGQAVRIIVPAGWGMTQMNGLLGTITAINTATNTITVNINSTAFTAFAFPTSALASNFSVPQVIPVGEAATSPYEKLLDDATDNVSTSGVIIGTGVQTTGVLYQWIARRGQSI
jgi:hypothetical protein